ncbi:hypothetical protein DB35_15930 [Streptomyces abyssalis]|uniref:hypothetical protein n=1 Tax=Streptomyces abyssalis TaxID=933944 RepID=UPI00085C5121|nr:hypothetical protein [Streptomyces abyssalis]OEU91538.1 hypothetical protein DB35_15930 [Streptomyces abyssalis]
MDDYADNAGRLLADRYRLPQPTADSYQLTESVAYDTASGQEVLVRQVPLPEVVEAEVLGDGTGVSGAGDGSAQAGALRGSIGRATRRPADPVVRRAVEAAVAAANLPDHPRLDQVFDVFVEGDGLWIVSELLPATPLAALLSHQTLTAHRAAEVAADVLTALRVVHAHGWTHRNVTPRTVLICDDGRALLTGLAVGAAEEALCGYSPHPDSGRLALPPSGSIPGEARPGGGSGGSGGSGGGPGEGDGPSDAPEGPAPAPWSDISLPDGFAARREDEPYGHRPGPYGTGGGRGHGQGHEPGRGDEAGRDYGTGDHPGSGRGPRGIFGLQGLSHGNGAAEEGDEPVRHGYETGGRSGRGRAIAAYQAGARRGAAARAHSAGPDGRDDQEGQEQGRRPERPQLDEAAGTAARDDWWNRAASTPPVTGPHTTPDDFVRWLPSGEDEVTPSDLPGTRVPNSLPVRATWRPAEPGGRPESETEPGAGPGAGPESGPRPTAARHTSGAFTDAFTKAPHSQEPDTDDPYTEGAYADPSAETSYEDPYTEDPYTEDPYTEDPYTDDPYDDAPEDRPWGGEGAEESGAPEGFHGPTTALAAERARQARMTVVGAVGERWAPEQAGPVHRNWRLAPPVGPAADLWALGVLLFRAVQGHGPYPEDDVAELVQMVCGEPPAFAEECGALRPVVESLLRQDPTERPDFEELRGWLRSLVRSAPEPDAGWHTVYAPSLDPGGTSDPRRLPILRRRGELVRRRRAARRAARAEQRQENRQQQRQRRQHRKQNRPRQHPPHPLPPHPLPSQHRHEPYEHEPYTHPAHEQHPHPQDVPLQQPAAPVPPKPQPEPAARDQAAPVRRKKQRQGARPRRLGGVLVGLVLAGLVAAMMYAVWFMPESDTAGAPGQQRGSVGSESRSPQPGEDGGGESQGAGDGKGGGGGSAEKPRPSAPADKAPEGYKLSRDPAGFQVAVPQEWNRRSTTGRGQVRYNGGDVEMVVVNGRDSVGKFGKDPMTYQSDDEPELNAYRASDWASTSGLRRIDVGETAMAEGTFSWKDGGRDVYARNRAMIIDGRYHVLMVMGSEGKKQQIDRHFESVADTYRPTGG